VVEQHVLGIVCQTCYKHDEVSLQHGSSSWYLTEPVTSQLSCIIFYAYMHGLGDRTGPISITNSRSDGL
jgi:hypothetical protein